MAELFQEKRWAQYFLFVCMLHNAEYVATPLYLTNFLLYPLIILKSYMIKENSYIYMSPV